MIKCYRVGKKDPSKDSDTRSILATFQRLCDVNMIMLAATQKPKGVPGGVHEDLPLPWAIKRKTLHQNIVIPARKEMDQVKIKWQYDNLIINGYKVEENDTWDIVKTKLSQK